MSILTEFPALGREPLRDLKKGIDSSFRDFSREYGQLLEDIFHPLLMFLKWFQDLLVETPWPIIIFVIGALAWIGSRNWYLVAGAIAALPCHWIPRHVGRRDVDFGDRIGCDIVVHNRRDSRRDIDGAQ